MDSPSPSQFIFVGRQPIYDKKLNVYGYELLFRAGDSVNKAVFADGDAATCQVVLNTFVEIGLDTIVGDKPAFLNLTQNLLLQGFPHQLPRNRVVIEILEDVSVDESVLAAVRKLREAHYTVVLDDFVYRAELQPLIEYADMVKVDVMRLDHEGLIEHADLLKTYNMTMVAEKVETQEEFEFCESLGFHLYQGYFFARPTIIKGQKIPASRLATLRLLSKLQESDSTVSELEQVISYDVSLSYKVLRIINSAFYGLSNKVNSIRHAVVLLGRERIKSWVALIVLEGVSNKPSELMVNTMIRAKMCELLGVALRREKEKDVYFTVGLFSALDAIFDMDMEEVLASLPLADDVLEALVKKEGLKGSTLSCVLAYERGDWERVVEALPLELEAIRSAYIESVRWATQVQKAMEE
ncbi:MAG: HDOD domain-containing protein [Pseudomonadota bacterium]